VTKDEGFDEMKRLLEDAAELSKLDPGFLTSTAGVSYCAGLMIGFSARAKGILRELKKSEDLTEEVY
jgi:hypothetical protein